MEVVVRRSVQSFAISGSSGTGCGHSRNNVSRPIKRSIAVLIRNGELILSVRRPDDDDELPGVWGLPAGTFRSSELVEDLIARIGQQKLGVTLAPIRKLTEGTQVRPAYRLQMELWEVSMEGTPTHPAYQWAGVDVLKAGMSLGSLCCELAVSLDATKGKSRFSL